MRIAVGGFLHESHSFAPRPTTWADFVRPGGFPGFVQGEALLPTLRGNANAIGGAIGVAEEVGAELVPLAWCIANPAGPVQDEAFERIAALLCAELAEAGRALLVTIGDGGKPESAPVTPRPHTLPGSPAMAALT